MAHKEDIAVLVCCHYHGSNILEREGMLDQALRSRGHSGRIVAVETKMVNKDDEVAESAVSVLRERRWGGILDNYAVAVGSFKHSIIVFRAAAGASGTPSSRKWWQFWKS
jgi:hypothetical protein